MSQTVDDRKPPGDAGPVRTLQLRRRRFEGGDALQDGAVEAIEKASGCSIEIFVSTGSEIQHSLKEYYGVSERKKNAGEMLAEVDMHEDEDKGGGHEKTA